MRRSVTYLALLVAGCGSPLTDARTSFDEARYPEAAAKYRALKTELPRLSRDELFEYALFRGLSHLALGDAGAAERWLTLAKRLVEATPHLASPDQRGRLTSAWAAMGHMPGD